MSELNILFTSAGRRVALIQNFKESLARLGISSRIVTTDFKKNAPASFIADAHDLVPKVTDSRYRANAS